MLSVLQLAPLYTAQPRFDWPALEQTLRGSHILRAVITMHLAALGRPHYLPAL